MNNALVIKKLRGVQSDKIILDILCKYLDDDIVEEIKRRRRFGMFGMNKEIEQARKDLKSISDQLGFTDKRLESLVKILTPPTLKKEN